jgi:hypothetical protein
LIINNIIIGNSKFENLKFLNNEQSQIIKKYIFPYRVISLQQKQISEFTELAKKLRLEYGNEEFSRLIFSDDKQRKFIKYIFPYKFISLQKKKMA